MHLPDQRSELRGIIMIVKLMSAKVTYLRSYEDRTYHLRQNPYTCLSDRGIRGVLSLPCASAAEYQRQDGAQRNQAKQP